MKKVILLLVISFVFFSCGGSRFLTDEESILINDYSLSQNKSQIKVSLLTYLNENFLSAKSTLQTSDDGIVSCNFNQFIGYYDRLHIYKLYANYTLIAKYEDNKCKTKIIIKGMEYMYDGIFGAVKENEWGSFSKEIRISMTKINDGLYNYLNSNDKF